MFVLYACNYLQISANHKSIQKKNREAEKMIVLGIIILLLAGYLVYALIHPEKL